MNRDYTDRLDDDLVAAVRQIESIEDYLQRHDHELADNLTRARVQLNGALMDEVIESYD